MPFAGIVGVKHRIITIKDQHEPFQFAHRRKRLRLHVADACHRIESILQDEKAADREFNAGSFCLPTDQLGDIDEHA